MFDYNTQRELITLKEYGRNVHRIAEYVMSVEDREKRTELSHALIELMRQVNPSTKDYHDNEQKIWDDLFIITNFQLDVDSPFPKPDNEILDRKPERMTYKDTELRFRHYGRHVEHLVERAIEIEEQEKREAAIILIGKLMKTFAGAYSKDQSDDKVILENIKKLSKGKLTMEVKPEDIENGIFEIYPPNPTQSKITNKSGGSSSSHGGGKKNRRRKRS